MFKSAASVADVVRGGEWPGGLMELDVRRVSLRFISGPGPDEATRRCPRPDAHGGRFP